MTKHHKVYRFRMRPTAEQECALKRSADARRFVWNWGLARQKEYHQATGNTLAYAAINKELTELKRQPGMEWLREADAQSLQEALRDLDRAFIAFFAKRARFPRFKSRKRQLPRFRTPQRAKISNNKVYVPKIGDIRIRQSQEIDGETKSATFKRDAKGYWFVSMIAVFEMPDIALPVPDSAKVVGIDLGLKDFAAFSDGSEPIPTPRFYRKGEAKQRKAQRVVSRRKNGSKRKAKAAKRVAIVYGKVADQRKDFLHKLTTRLVRQHDGLCIEDLCVHGLARTKLSKSVTDAGWGEFRRQLTYKSEWNRKHLVVIDRFFPSSKRCNACGAINEGLTLNDRGWDCDCGVHHDRDLNAAKNIRDEGLRLLAVGHTER